MKYTPSQVAKAITSLVTTAVALGIAVALALSDGRVTTDEWVLLIPAIGNLILNPLGVFTVPNGLAGDKDQTKTT